MNEEIQKIIKLYTEEKISSIKIANIIGKSKYYVLSKLKQNNITRRKSHETKCAHSNLNTSFFEKIDSEEKAYFLGIFYADGCNMYPKYISLALQKRDENILYKLKNIIDHPIR